MTWGVIVDVPAPAGLYDAVHAAVLERVAGAVPGLLVHLARATDGGFQVIEVWESREDYDHQTADVLLPVLTELAGDRPASGSGQTETPFEVRGLILSGERVAW